MFWLKFTLHFRVFQKALTKAEKQTTNLNYRAQGVFEIQTEHAAVLEPEPKISSREFKSEECEKDQDQVEVKVLNYGITPGPDGPMLIEDNQTLEEKECNMVIPYASQKCVYRNFVAVCVPCTIVRLFLVWSYLYTYIRMIQLYRLYQ